ncbi:MAG: hypothetical protein KDA41_09185, partial [Planctomycetales bacterium]|nr:hypothetical protein [Planctomycetales bacterium]
THTATGLLVYGALVAFALGLAALWGLVRLLQRGQLHWFALWCIPLGALVVVWQIWPGAFQ